MHGDVFERLSRFKNVKTTSCFFHEMKTCLLSAEVDLVENKDIARASACWVEKYLDCKAERLEKVMIYTWARYSATVEAYRVLL